jgi:hypothetical protein
MPQPLKLAGGVGGALLICRQTHTLLHNHSGGVVLEVEHILHVPGQQSHPGLEVRALEVKRGLQGLLPYGVLLIPNREKRDRQCCCSGKAVLARGGEGDVHHHVNTGVGLAAGDRPRPRLRGVEGYHHAKLTPIQAVGHGQSVMVDQSVPVAAKMEECII